MTTILHAEVPGSIQGGTVIATVLTLSVVEMGNLLPGSSFFYCYLDLSLVDERIAIALKLTYLADVLFIG
ncbi:hypothetical protein [Pseudoalteromonas rubra]|uniref:hypothetical protein n=1 Tax=Pseudoalteromonas rubra TaxID=43658 RepID=UPI0012F74F3A|nr:hypothetical protein [Pseudoalteromonas rubra]